MSVRIGLSSAANVLLVLLCGYVALAQTGGSLPGTATESAHRVAIQVSENEPKSMNLALNNARNVADYYKSKNMKVAIEIVTYGPGLHMLRADTSPVRQRIAEMSLAMQEISFAACANTQANMAKQEGKEIPLLSEARIVPSGVVRLIELQKDGYAYIRP